MNKFGIILRLEEIRFSELQGQSMIQVRKAARE